MYNYKKHRYVNTISGWNNIRKSILERDHHQCQVCGKKPSGQVHHLVTRRDGGGNEPTNLVILCGQCHMLVSPVPDQIISRVWHIPSDAVKGAREKVKTVLINLSLSQK